MRSEDEAESNSFRAVSREPSGRSVAHRAAADGWQGARAQRVHGHGRGIRPSHPGQPQEAQRRAGVQAVLGRSQVGPKGEERGHQQRHGRHLGLTHSTTILRLLLRVKKPRNWSLFYNSHSRKSYFKIFRVLKASMNPSKRT